MCPCSYIYGLKILQNPDGTENGKKWKYYKLVFSFLNNISTAKMELSKVLTSVPSIIRRSTPNSENPFPGMIDPIL